MKKLLLIFSLLTFTAVLGQGQEVYIYDVNICKQEIGRKDRDWLRDSENMAYKKMLPEEVPFDFVSKYPGNEYNFFANNQPDRNMAEVWADAFESIKAMFGPPAFVEAGQGSIATIELKEKEDGSVYFFNPKWDFDKNAPDFENGDTLSVEDVYGKIKTYREQLTLEWDFKQKDGYLLKLIWNRNSVRLKTLDYNQYGKGKK